MGSGITSRVYGFVFQTATRQDKTTQHKIRQDEERYEKTKQGQVKTETRRDETMQAMQGKVKKGTTRPDKNARQG